MEEEGRHIKRLDAALVERGLAPARERAKEAIVQGRVRVNGRTVTKAAFPVGPADAVLCEGEGPRYVGRGGEKLQKALEVAGFPLTGLCALDVGASTGGFTDCLLQHGAAEVFAVDVGKGQLHPSLLSDPRVHSLENTDVRDTEKIREYLTEKAVQICTIDVSFISLDLIFPAVLPLLSPGALLICLIKPQFEAGRGALGNSGVVRHKADHVRVLRDKLRLFRRWGCELIRLDYSPIAGGAGNREYLAVLKTAAALPAAGTEGHDLQKLVDDAFRSLGR